MRLLTVLARVLSWPIVLSLVAAACGGGGTTAPTGGATAAPTTAALNWPTQPSTLIVSFAAGCGTAVTQRDVLLDGPDDACQPGVRGGPDVQRDRDWGDRAALGLAARQAELPRAARAHVLAAAGQGAAAHGAPLRLPLLRSAAAQQRAEPR